MARQQKQKCAEMEVSEMEESNTATMHGMFIGAVSPVKCSRTKAEVKYFEGQLSDGKKTVRMVSFEPKLRAEVEKARESGEGVAVTNCTVQKSRKEGCDALEIVAGHRTNVVKSPKKFKVDDEAIRSAAVGVCSSMDVKTLEEIKDLGEGQHVNVKGKIQSIQPVEKVLIKSRGQTPTKADFVLADCTAVCWGVAWEGHISMLKEDKSYNLKGATIRSFNQAKYVSLGEHATIETVKDIGEVVNEVVADGAGGAKVVEGEIVGVVGCDGYRSCRSCNAKVVEVSKVVGECSKCGMKMKISRCGKSVAARLVIEDDEGKEHKATAFNDVVDDIIRGVDGENLEKMLSAPVMKFTITTRNTISSVTK